MRLLRSLLLNSRVLSVVVCGLLLPSVGAICRDPPSVTNAVVMDSKTEYEVGEIVRYKCLIGYTIEGQSRITCNQDGTWTNIAFSCEGISCRPPQKPNNGRIIGTVYTFGELVQFACNDGYLMYDSTGSKLLTKSPIRQCTADGSWSSYSPTCKVIQCPDLTDIQDGKIDLRTKSYGSVVRYQCDAEFKLKGNSERICQADGQWSGSEPTCEGITCAPPEKFAGGDVELVTFTEIGDRLIYKCDDGTELQAICNEHGEWEPGPPPCMAGTSTEPTTPITMTTKVPTTSSITVARVTTTTKPSLNSDGPEDATTEGPPVPGTSPVPTVIVIPIIFGILVIACSVAGYVFWKKKKNDKNRKDPMDVIKPEELHHLSTVPSQQI